MSAQLSRLQAFLEGAGELQVITPPAEVRPDYFARFARLAGATLVAAQVATAAAGEPVLESAPAPAAAVEVPASAETAEKQRVVTAMRQVRDLSARYLSHGRSPLKPHIVMIDPDKLPDEGPLAIVEIGEVCRIEGIRTDYSRTDPRLAVMGDTPAMRAFVLVHESMHCRVGPALLRHVPQFQSSTSGVFAVIFNESAADAHGVLTLARKDGIPAALEVLDRMVEVRAAEAALPESDGHHDSRETLLRVRALLEHAPERLNSDAAAFSLAITEALSGAVATLQRALPPEQAGYSGTPEYKADMARLQQAVEEMARDYLAGTHDLGAPRITLNNLVLQPQAKPTGSQSAWSLLAKLKPAEPSFTAAGLRKEAEAITSALPSSASASPPAAVAAAAAVAVASAPAGQRAGAIGRLRSHIGSVYSSALHSTGSTHPSSEEPVVEEAQRAGL